MLHIYESVTLKNSRPDRGLFFKGYKSLGRFGRRYHFTSHRLAAPTQRRKGTPRSHHEGFRHPRHRPRSLIRRSHHATTTQQHGRISQHGEQHPEQHPDEQPDGVLHEQQQVGLPACFLNNIFLAKMHPFCPRIGLNFKAEKGIFEFAMR